MGHLTLQLLEALFWGEGNENMFSIGEFSKIAGLPVRTLRFYHEKGLLVPAAVDAETSYRSYDERNLATARVIVALRSMEFSLEEIAEILAGSSEDADIVAHLERQKHTLLGRARHYRSVARQIDGLIRRENERREEKEMKTTDFGVVEQDVVPQLVAGVRMTGRYCDIGQGFAKLYRRLGRRVAGKPLCLYYDGEYREEDANFEPCVPIREIANVDGIELHDLSGVRCVTLMHQGPYEELSNSYARVMKYAKEHRYEIELPTREVYHKGPGIIFRGNPKRYLTEIQLPIQKR